MTEHDRDTAPAVQPTEEPAVEPSDAENADARTDPGAEPDPQPLADQPVVVEEAPAVTEQDLPAEPPAEGEPPSGAPEAVVGSGAKPKPPRPRRRRPTAAERHRRAFFAKLNELRRAERPAPVAASAAEAPAGEPAEAPPAEEPAAEQAEAPAAEQVEAPAAEQAQAPEVPAPVEEQPAPESAITPTRARARLLAAIERVGGAEVVRDALKPKRDAQNQPLKWAAVCCQQSEGRKPGDPVFAAWLRLAATPVREIKPHVEDRSDERRGGPRRDGPRRDDRGRGGPRRDDRGGRPARGGRGAGREELAQHAHGGTFRPTIRIIGLDGPDPEGERGERERALKEEREAKRKAEEERLRRIGY